MDKTILATTGALLLTLTACGRDSQSYVSAAITTTSNGSMQPLPVDRTLSTPVTVDKTISGNAAVLQDLRTSFRLSAGDTVHYHFLATATNDNEKWNQLFSMRVDCFKSGETKVTARNGSTMNLDFRPGYDVSKTQVARGVFTAPADGDYNCAPTVMTGRNAADTITVTAAKFSLRKLNGFTWKDPRGVSRGAGDTDEDDCKERAGQAQKSAKPCESTRVTLGDRSRYPLLRGDQEFVLNSPEVVVPAGTTRVTVVSDVAVNTCDSLSDCAEYAHPRDADKEREHVDATRLTTQLQIWQVRDDGSRCGGVVLAPVKSWEITWMAHHSKLYHKINAPAPRPECLDSNGQARYRSRLSVRWMGGFAASLDLDGAATTGFFLFR